MEKKLSYSLVKSWTTSINSSLAFLHLQDGKASLEQKKKKNTNLIRYSPPAAMD